MNPAISDLFFNYDHSRWSELVLDLEANDDELNAALLADATEFAESINMAFGVELDPAALVEDFNGRA